MAEIPSSPLTAPSLPSPPLLPSFTTPSGSLTRPIPTSFLTSLSARTASKHEAILSSLVRVCRLDEEDIPVYQPSSDSALCHNAHVLLDRVVRAKPPHPDSVASRPRLPDIFYRSEHPQTKGQEEEGSPCAEELRDRVDSLALGEFEQRRGCAVDPLQALDDALVDIGSQGVRSELWRIV